MLFSLEPAASSRFRAEDLCGPLEKMGKPEESIRFLCGKVPCFLTATEGPFGCAQPPCKGFAGEMHLLFQRG